MQIVPPFDPHRFTSTVQHYRRHRLRYPDRLIHTLAEAVPLGPTARVLDLGCGPGFIAIALAPYAQVVIGIDPDAAMIEAAREEAADAGADVEWRIGSSFDLPDELNALDLVTMGRSFHWMDREGTLERLEELVAPGGVIGLMADRRVDAPVNRWRPAFEMVRDSWKGRDSFESFRRSADWEPHESVLLRSPFSLVERISVIEMRATSVDDQIGRALSQSSTAPAVLGERRSGFENALREALAPFADAEGNLRELVEYYAVLARRP